MNYLKALGAPGYYTHRMSIVLHGNTEGTEAARHHRFLAMVFECVPAFVPAHVPVFQELRPCRIARRGLFLWVRAYFGRASRITC